MRDVTELKKAQEREVEMRLARVVQQKLYPVRAPEIEGFDLAGAAFPADHTCGDYYDFVPFPDGRVGIAVGDVSGHGFGPALLMAETRAYLRSLSRTSSDLGQILRRLNRFLCQDTEDERFVTLMVTLLDPARGARVLERGAHPRLRPRPHAGPPATSSAPREPRSGSSRRRSSRRARRCRSRRGTCCCC